ncbi:MAG: FAD-binding oxidoreductase [Candidatus Lambdaproteobacteria bacterium]|nr:FAD-binding oxidoreductase [Candidatus Lambdaproteobacteria bacterium]
MALAFDGIIIGAGVMGASAAMHLASAGMKRLLLLEKGPGVGSGSTGKSSACIRQTYSHYEVCLMAYEALQLFKNWQDFTGLEAPRANFVNCGVLFLVDKDDASVPKILDIHRRVGVKSAVLDDKARLELFPDVDFRAPPAHVVGLSDEAACDVVAVHEHEGGFADPVGTAEDMLDVARRLGAQARFKARVVKILQQGGRIAGIEADIAGQREVIHAPVVVNCAGPWAMGINRLAGVSLPQKLVATRNQIVSKQFPETLRGNIPMIIDMVNGIYCRLEANREQIITGSVREEDEREQVADPDHYNEVADAPFREEKLALLHHRVSTFEARGNITSYAGLYTVNQDDYHPIIDRAPLEGFFPVCGFSGHGFKLSPVVGALVAQKVLGQWGRVTSGVPTGFFNADRPRLTTNWGGVIA